MRRHPRLLTPAPPPRWRRLRERMRWLRRAAARLGRRLAAWWRGQPADAAADIGSGERLRSQPPSAAPAPGPESDGTATGYDAASSTDAPRPAATAAPPVPPRPSAGRRYAVALQGGGAFGALAAGALCRLLEAGPGGLPPLERLAAISGTSAGAVNAALLTSGWVRGGSEGARATLAAFWRELGAIGNWQALFGLGAAGIPASAGAASFWGPAAAWTRAWGQPLADQLSPYQTNPLDLNPLRQLLARHVDPLALRAAPWRLALAATRVADGRLQLFGNDDFDARRGIEPILASACLPLLMQAVQIDGEAYWDGGFSANPPLAPLAADPAVGNILLLTVAPPPRVPATPRQRAAIGSHALHIQFDAVLQAELRLWQALQARIDAHPGVGRALPELLRLDLHDHDAAALAGASALDARAARLEALWQHGHEQAGHWLALPTAHALRQQIAEA
jgi:NTE family protein